MASMPYNYDSDIADYTDKQDQTLEPDRSVANNNGSSQPPAPKAYQPPAEEAPSQTATGTSGARQPTFTEMQSSGEARPPAPQSAVDYLGNVGGANYPTVSGQQETALPYGRTPIPEYGAATNTQMPFGNPLQGSMAPYASTAGNTQTYNFPEQDVPDYERRSDRPNELGAGTTPVYMPSMINQITDTGGQRGGLPIASDTTSPSWAAPKTYQAPTTTGMTADEQSLNDRIQRGDPALQAQYQQQYGNNWLTQWGADQDRLAAKAVQQQTGMAPTGYGSYTNAQGQSVTAPISQIPTGTQFQNSAPLIGTTAGGTMSATGTSANPFAGYVGAQGGTFGGAFADKGAAAPLWGSVSNGDPDAIKKVLNDASADPQLKQMASDQLSRWLTMNDTQGNAANIIRTLSPDAQAQVQKTFTTGYGGYGKDQAGYDANRPNQSDLYQRTWSNLVGDNYKRDQSVNQVLASTFVPGVGSARVEQNGNIVSTQTGNVMGNVNDPKLDMAKIRQQAIDEAKSAPRPDVQASVPNSAEAQKAWDAAHAAGGFFDKSVDYSWKDGGQLVPTSQLPAATTQAPVNNWTAANPTQQQAATQEMASAAQGKPYVPATQEQATSPFTTTKTTTSAGTADPNAVTKAATTATPSKVATQTTGSAQTQTSTTDQNQKAIGAGTGGGVSYLPGGITTTYAGGATGTGGTGQTGTGGTGQIGYLPPPSTGGADILNMLMNPKSAIGNVDIAGMLTKPPTATGGVDIASTLAKGVTGGGPGSDVQAATNQAILSQLQNPSAYGSEQVKNAYDWLGAQIDDQYALEQKKLVDEMSRRGLSNSSIMAGRMADLNMAKRSAKESMAYDLAQNLAKDYAAARQGAISQGLTGSTAAQSNAQNWLNSLMGYNQQGVQNNLATAQALANYGQQGYQNNLNTAAALMGYGQQAFQNDLAAAEFNANQNNQWQNFLLQMLGQGYGG